MSRFSLSWVLLMTKRIGVHIGIILFSLGHALVNASEFEWPDKQQLAVNLSYDDALNSQLDHAYPVLQKYQIKGSFFLTLANSTINDRLEEWRNLAGQGHELGNHTLFHPCRKSPEGREWVPSYRNADIIPMQQMVEEVRLANVMLFAIDGRQRRTFTPPCGDSLTNMGNYTQLLQEEFVAIKWQNRFGPKFDQVYMPHGDSGDQLIAYVKQAKQNGGALTIIFHGVGGDHLAVSQQAHEKLVAYLAANKKDYWTDSYINIMSYVEALNAEH